MMTTRSLMRLSLAATFFSAGSFASAQSAASAAGHWEGKIQYGNPPLPVTLDLSKNATGAWVGAFSVPGSTTVDVPLANIVIDSTGVRFTLALPENPSFEGTISADGKSFSGSAANSQGSARFDMTRSGEAHVSVPAPSSALPAEFEGRWEGAIDVGGQQRRIGLRFARAADGTAAGTLTAIDQGGQEFQVTTTTITGKDLQLELRALSGAYHGTLGAAGAIAGEWSQGGQKVPLTFKRVEAAAAKP